MEVSPKSSSGILLSMSKNKYSKEYAKVAFSEFSVVLTPLVRSHAIIKS